MKKKTEKKIEALEISNSSGNVFADLKIKNPEKYLVKSGLAYKINSILQDLNMSQAEVAKILGIDQPKISDLNCGRLDGFSIERLFTFLNKLSRDVEIVISNTHSSQFNQGHLRLSAG